MVSITVLKGLQAIVSYYDLLDDYYAKQYPGEWYGKGAEALGLGGPVERDALSKILQGFDLDGQQLIKAGPNKEHRPGVDLTFSPPKSFSVLSIYDDRLADIHHRAVKSTLEYLEPALIQARNTHDGLTSRINTDKMVAALYQHHLSRELDPQIHTHVVIANMTRDESGEWKAISNEELFRNKMLLGQIYRNELAHLLTKEMGYAIRSDSKGLFEISGVDSQVVDAFSARSKQIEALVSELRDRYPSADGQKLREIAAIDSREAKRDVSVSELRELWESKIQELGQTKESIFHAVEDAAQKSQLKSLSVEQYIIKGIEVLIENESVFTKEELLKESARLSIGNETINTLDKGINASVERGEIVQLAANAYTTPEMLRVEAQIVEMVQRGQHAVPPIYNDIEVDKRIKESDVELNYGQAEVVKGVYTLPHRVVAVNGPPGVGKSTAAGVAKQIAPDDVNIRGLTITGKAASELESVGVKSSTIHSFLQSSERTISIRPSREIWLVDEASMAGSVVLHQILSRAEAYQARVVLMGDTQQLPSIEAGMMFGQLQKQNHIHTVRMDEIVRQRNPAYRDVVVNFSSKRIDEAFSKIERLGKLVQEPDRESRLFKVAKEFSARDSEERLLIASINRDRKALNDLVRKNYQDQGVLAKSENLLVVRHSKGLSSREQYFASSYAEGDVIYARKSGVLGRAGAEARIVDTEPFSNSIIVKTDRGIEQTINLTRDGNKIGVFSEEEQSFAVGDKIAFGKNDRSLGVQNGSTGLIQSIDSNGRLSVQLSSGREISFTPEQYGYFDYGYVSTAYKSQGQTSREVFVFTDTKQHQSFNSLLVSISRGKDDLKIYTDDSSRLIEQAKHEQIKSSTLEYSQPERISQEVQHDRGNQSLDL